RPGARRDEGVRRVLAPRRPRGGRARAALVDSAAGDAPGLRPGRRRPCTRQGARAGRPARRDRLLRPRRLRPPPHPKRLRGPRGPGVSGLLRRRTFLRADEPRASYDVVIVGGGGHGLATAYSLASRHGIRSVAVLERSYIGAGGTGRNTTILRANYKQPETIAFFKASFDLYSGLAQELELNMLRSRRGLLWLAHTENALR